MLRVHNVVRKVFALLDGIIFRLDYLTPRECSWAGELIAVSRMDLDSWSFPFS